MDTDLDHVALFDDDESIFIVIIYDSYLMIIEYRVHTTCVLWAS